MDALNQMWAWQVGLVFLAALNLGIVYGIHGPSWVTWLVILPAFCVVFSMWLRSIAIVWRSTR